MCSMAFGNIARIEAVTHKDKVYTLIWINGCCSLGCKYIAIAILVVVLLNINLCAVIFTLKQEYNLACATFVRFGCVF